MVLRVDVVAAALDAVYGGPPDHRVIALTPQGRQLDQAAVEELAGRGAADAALGPLRGLRRADRRASLLGRDLDRPVRALRRRAAGDGARRRDRAAAARRARRGLGRAGDVLARSSTAGREYPAVHAPRRVSRLAGARGAALGRPRADRGLAARAEPGAERTLTDLYAVLGVPPDASEDEIRDAYYRHLRFDDLDTGDRSRPRRELREAYEVLSDPERRPSYDASQAPRRAYPRRRRSRAAAAGRAGRRSPYRRHARNPVDAGDAQACRAAGGSRSTGW